MTNTSYWTKFVNNFADQAIGGPTRAQLLKSYNDKFGTNFYVDSDGKTIRKEDGSYGQLRDDGGFYDISKPYYLSEKATSDFRMVYIMYTYGKFSYESCGNGGNQVRPLVRLKSDVKMTWNGTAWDLSI